MTSSVVEMCQPRLAVDGRSFRGGVCSLCDSRGVMLRRQPRALPQSRGSGNPRPRSSLQTQRCAELSMHRGNARARGGKTPPPSNDFYAPAGCPTARPSRSSRETRTSRHAPRPARRHTCRVARRPAPPGRTPKDAPSHGTTTPPRPPPPRRLQCEGKKDTRFPPSPPRMARLR